MHWCLTRKRHMLVIPNSQYLVQAEADVLSVTYSGLVHEYEIKVSNTDYNREFTSKTKKVKHSRLQKRSERGPNYFWFVTYDFVIEPPDYAGWIIARPLPSNNYLLLTIKKEAPKLHKRKWDDRRMAKAGRLLGFRLIKEYEKQEELDTTIQKYHAFIQSMFGEWLEDDEAADLIPPELKA